MDVVEFLNQIMDEGNDEINQYTNDFEEIIRQFKELDSLRNIIVPKYQNRIKELEKELELKDSWVKHHQKSVEIAVADRHKTKEIVAVGIEKIISESDAGWTMQLKSSLTNLLKKIKE
jgi:adenine deaminase